VDPPQRVAGSGVVAASPPLLDVAAASANRCKQFAKLPSQKGRRRLLASLLHWGDRVVDVCLGSRLAWTTVAPVGAWLPAALEVEQVEVPIALVAAGRERLRELSSDSTRCVRLSTCFSGLGTAELCSRTLNGVFAKRGLGLHFQTDGAFELDASARKVLGNDALGGFCGGNLLDLWPEPVRERLNQGFGSFPLLGSYLTRNAARLAASAVCPDTGRRWTIDLGDIHCGGNPCTDWSALGNRQGLEGPTAAALVTWALLLVRHMPALIVQENVLAFPIRI
jgi:hypothetical protein